MHKNMHEIQSKDWDKMQHYFEWNKDKYDVALKAMEQHREFDFKKMFLEDPELFVFFVSIHTENRDTYDVEKFWELHYTAYQTLKSNGLFQINFTEQKLQLVNEFENKLNGICLIAKKELKDTITIKKKKNQTSVHVDFHEVLDLIEKNYNISVRGFFDNLKYEKIKEIYGKYYNIADYDKVARTSPVDSIEANYLNIISDHVREQFEYIDFWDYLLDNEFCNISNGSIANMYEPEDNNDVIIEDIINESNEFEDYLSNNIKKVFFKELSQLREIDIEEGIDFLIEW